MSSVQKRANPKEKRLTPSQATKKADKLFSLWVRERDKWCLRCKKTERLQNSHFWSRAVSTTRYHPWNCKTLCAGCHMIWERQKQGDYQDFMIKWLGKKNYTLLRQISTKMANRQQRVTLCLSFLQGEISEKEYIKKLNSEDFL